MRNLKSWIGNLTGTADITKALKTATGSVDGSAAAQPTVGMVPTVDVGGTTFSWAIPPGGGSTNNNRVATFSIDGGGALPPTGLIGYTQIPFAGTITGWSIVTKDGQTVTAQFDVWKLPNSNGNLPTVADTITASAKPVITAVNHTSSTTLTGWTTAVTQGDWIAVNLDSISGLAGGVVLQLKFTAS